MTATVLRGDALALPLADASVDLVVTSPPYFGLRSYTDGGRHYTGQVGAEATPAAYVDALLAATREMVRVIKPSGSIWVNLGDKYASSGGHGAGATSQRADRSQYIDQIGRSESNHTGYPSKTLLGIPWRYALGCIDQLGLILRAEVIWSKPNGLPESVTDRVRRSHEQWFHFVTQPRYYSAVDEIREGYTAAPFRGQITHKAGQSGATKNPIMRSLATWDASNYEHNPLGKLPGSVWTIPTEPLQTPNHLGVDHFAAFPTEWPRRIITGWSPPGVCVQCGEGRRATSTSESYTTQGPNIAMKHNRDRGDGGGSSGRLATRRTITGYVCACTPYTDHPGTGESSGPYGRHALAVEAGTYENVGAGWGGKSGLGDRPRVGPWREYHHDRWTPPPTTPAIVLDPFGGTGTVALVADILGCHGISVDLSQDYNRLAAWRTRDPAQRARAARVDKPPPVIDGQLDLLDVAHLQTGGKWPPGGRVAIEQFREQP